MDADIVILIVLSVVSIPLYLLIGMAYFGGWADFWESVKFWFTPDIFSLFRGELWDDRWAELKLGIFLLTCGGCVYGEFLLVQKFFMD